MHFAVALLQGVCLDVVTGGGYQSMFLGLLHQSSTCRTSAAGCCGFHRPPPGFIFPFNGMYKMRACSQNTFQLSISICYIEKMELKCYYANRTCIKQETK